MSDQRTARRPSARTVHGQGRPESKRLSIATETEAALPMLRTSERSCLKRCEFDWYISYERKLRMGIPAPALRFGTLIHRSLADYYIKGTKRGKNPVRSFERHYKADMIENETIFGARVDDDEVWINAHDLGVAMLTSYLEEYGTDPDWEVLATEQPFRVLVQHPETGEPWFWYTGVVDGIWRNRISKELWIIDHKSAKSTSDSKLAYLQLDDQAGAYWSWGVDWLTQQGILKKNQHLHGMMYNFLKKGMPDERPSKVLNGKRQYLNKDGTVSKVQPSPMFKRMPIYRDEPDRAMARLRSTIDYKRLEDLRAGRMQLSKSPGQFTCPMCSVRDVCELHETGQDWEGFLGQTSAPWLPYSEHEIYEGR